MKLKVKKVDRLVSNVLDFKLQIPSPIVVVKFAENFLLLSLDLDSYREVLRYPVFKQPLCCGYSLCALDFDRT